MVPKLNRPKEIDLLNINGGSVEAPAGCGKTDLIVRALKRHLGPKPILVLTHTNAGVAALRQRLLKKRVSRAAYQIYTLDGWAMRLLHCFPQTSEVSREIFKLESPSSDYSKIRCLAAELVISGHIQEVLQSSYERVFVDEYQDCNLIQHKLMVGVSDILPTCVLGDPMQAIFGFGGSQLVEWTKEVAEDFPPEGFLDKPWRWINAGTEHLGKWLLQVREDLKVGRYIDLDTAPCSVKWIEMDCGEDCDQKRIEAVTQRPSYAAERTLILSDSKDPQRQQYFARCIPKSVVAEAVDLKDLMKFAKEFNLEDGFHALGQLLVLCESAMTNVDAEALLQIACKLEHNHQAPQFEMNLAVMDFLKRPSFQEAANLLEIMSKRPEVQVFRPLILESCIRTLRLRNEEKECSLLDAAIRIREKNRRAGRKLERRTVGSTLLLKGLESEVAVILEADMLDPQNLYVAVTRGSKALTVCSESTILNPHHLY